MLLLFLCFADLHLTVILGINQLDAQNFVLKQDLSQPVHRTVTYRCDDIRCCMIKFGPSDDKHNSARNM